MFLVEHDAISKFVLETVVNAKGPEDKRYDGRYRRRRNNQLYE